ncbi:MAG: MBL fold metallo-hydrolase [Lachnospiraceae bacterium]|nr:MBL fold metallo-hydrolase [Lachnospiraceae bacterium]
MKIAENVHLIRQEFYVTPEVKRFINIYLIVGESCYLIDSGVAGSKYLIYEYLKSIGRNISDIKGIFLTHSHPDHIGGAAEIKRSTDCKVYAPALELNWIEDIDIQFRERPIPNFFSLLKESVKVDAPLHDGDRVILEKGLEICAVLTPGHSRGSMSFVLDNDFVFTGDAIPVAHDLPIFVDYKESIYSLDRINELSEVNYFCPAWDEIYDKTSLKEVINDSKRMLHRLKDVVHKVEGEYKEFNEDEKLMMIFKQADILQYAGNPLVVKSIEACREYLYKIYC